MSDDLDDLRLAHRAAGGDNEALRVLMQRYDRLVRYTVFRLLRAQCARDPNLLDTLAADTWTGFLASVHSTRPLQAAALKAYLTRIARNKAVSALRTARPAGTDVTQARELVASGDFDPASLVEDMEALENLRQAIDRLDETDRLIMGEVSLIVSRRWQEAAERLAMPESTLRSKWKRILEQLRGMLR